MKVRTSNDRQSRVKMCKQERRSLPPARKRQVRLSEESPRALETLSREIFLTFTVDVCITFSNAI
jgi:hypothetical protein